MLQTAGGLIAAPLTLGVEDINGPLMDRRCVTVAATSQATLARGSAGATAAILEPRLQHERVFLSLSFSSLWVSLVD